MTAHTADATLDAEVSARFPVRFPFGFGPAATMSYGAGAAAMLSTRLTVRDSITLLGVIDTAETITADPDAAASWHALMSAVIDGILAAPAGRLVADFRAQSSVAMVGNRVAGTGYNDIAQATLGGVVTGSATMSHASAIFSDIPAITAVTHAAATSHHIADTELSAHAKTPSATRLHGQLTAATGLQAAATAALSRQGLISATLQPAATAATAIKRATVISATQSVTVRPSTSARVPHRIDAHLGLSIYQPFPYVFPFVFEKSTDTLGAGRSFHAATQIDADTPAIADRGQTVSAAASATATATASLLQGFEELIDTTLRAQLHASAAVTHGWRAGTTTNVTANTATNIALVGKVNTATPIDITPAAITHWTSSIGAGLQSVADTQAATQLHGKLDTSMPVDTGTSQTARLNRTLTASTATVAATTAVAGITYGVDAITVNIQAGLEATLPEMTGFWTFYLR